MAFNHYTLHDQHNGERSRPTDRKAQHGPQHQERGLTSPPPTYPKFYLAPVSEIISDIGKPKWELQSSLN
jgi:hypothetical protein